MLRDFIEELVKNDPGYILSKNFTKKDRNDIEKFSDYGFSSHKYIAFKNESTLFKKQGILIATDCIIYGKQKEVLLTNQKDVVCKNGKYILTKFKGYSDEVIPNYPTLIDVITKINQYYKNSVIKAKEALENHDIENAIIYSRQAAEFEAIEDVERLGYCYEAVGDINKGLDCFKIVAKDTYYRLNNAYSVMKEADLLYKEKKYLYAYSLYSRLLEDKEDVKAMYRIADMHYYGQGIKKNINAALHWYDKAYSRDTENGHVIAQLVKVHRDLGDYDKMNHFMCLYGLDSDDKNEAHAINLLYGYGFSNKNYQTACAYFKELVLKRPYLYYEYALALLGANRLDEFFDAMNNSLNNQDHRALIGVGNAYRYGLGTDIDRNKAIEFYSEAIKHKEVKAEAYLLLGEMHDTIDDKKAYDFYQEALKLGNLQANAHIGIMYLEGRFVEQSNDRGFNIFREGIKAGSIYGKVFLVKSILKRKYFEYDEKLAGDIIINLIANEFYTCEGKKLYIEECLGGIFEELLIFEEELRKLEQYLKDVIARDPDYEERIIEIKEEIGI